MCTLVAANAVVGLAQLRYTAVVSDKEGSSSLAVVLVLATLGYISLIYTFVIVQKYSRNVYSVRAGHAIFAIVA